MRRNKYPQRTGTVLILVAAMSALLVSLSVAFLARMRSDAEESEGLMREAQARIMLTAACNYIQETSRLGWATPGSSTRREAFGWVDVRDGSNGPNDETGAAAFTNTSFFPAIRGRAARCPMFVMARPPFAIELTMTPNPIVNDPTKADFGMPYLRNRDPIPLKKTWAEFVTGDSTPRQQTQNRAWFRAFRDGPATFVITCGAGGTGGFSDWNDVTATPGAAAIFGNDPLLFDDLLSHERRMWYRVEWSPAVPVDERKGSGFSTNAMWTKSGSAVNPVGTIQWIQRLIEEPSEW